MGENIQNNANNRICSEELMEFILNAPKKLTLSEEKIVALGNTCAPVLKKLGVAKLYVRIADQEELSSFGKMRNRLVDEEPEEEDKGILIYDSEEEAGFTEVKCAFETDDKGEMTFTAYPLMDTDFTADAEQDVKLFEKVLASILEKSKYYDLLKKTMRVDQLTGCGNTAALMKFIGNIGAKEIQSEYAAVFADIRKFRIVNKQIGTRGGDIALREFGHAIKEMTDPDEIAVRLGGDKFVIIVKKEKAETVAKNVENMQVNIRLGAVDRRHGKLVDLIANVGIYYINANDTPDRIMVCLSTSVNEAKKLVDENIVVFEQGLLNVVNKENGVTMRFANALVANEFLVYYQPKIDSVTKKLCGAEALTRWKNKELYNVVNDLEPGTESENDIVYPGSFIPVLEANGGVCQLDFYVLERVCHDIRNWIDIGIEPVRISVNFSRSHIKNADLAERIKQVLDSYEIDSKYLEIEITELSDIEDTELMHLFIKKLKEFGIKVSIDDYGTGYSSLMMLKKYDVDVIKMDKVFIDDIVECKLNYENNISNPDANQKDYIITRNTLQLANELGIETVAEGVETEMQYEVLKELNCKIIQGYYFDKPISHGNFQKKLSVRQY